MIVKRGVFDEALIEVMNQSSAEYPSEVDEFKEVGLTPIKSDFVNAPRAAESPVNMECKVLEILTYGEKPVESSVIIGEVVLVHIKDELWAENEIAISKWKPIGRLGGKLYCRINEMFAMERPGIR
jgi:flavin reductase (DIM6/NTAB) family NADH-FMN oxidoreductase RutF